MTVKEQLQELTQKVDKMQAMIEVLLNSIGGQSPPPTRIPSGTIIWGGYSDTYPAIIGAGPNYSFIGGGKTNTISSPNFPESDQ